MTIKSHRNKIRVRRSGWAFLIVFLLVQLAAWNTGTNLLYMIVGALVSMILLGWLLGRESLRHLDVTREAPASVHRGDRFSSTIRIVNRRRFFPAVSLRVYGSVSDDDWYTYVPRIFAEKAVTVRASNSLTSV